MPVMAKEVVDILKPQDGKVYIDMTFGAGGHTKALLDTNKSIKIIAIDRDPVAIEKAQELANQVAIKSERLNINQTVIPLHGKFSQIMKQIHLNGILYGSVNGVLFDLGASTLQYEDPKRGFSLTGNGPLDMRMDATNSFEITAEDVINNLSIERLAQIFKVLGGERKYKKYAHAILDARTLLGRLNTTQELARIMFSMSPSTIDDLSGTYSHPGSKIFQALRIFVNNELNELNYGLSKIRDYIVPANPNSESSSSILDENNDIVSEDRFDSECFTNQEDNPDTIDQEIYSKRSRKRSILGQNVLDKCGVAVVLTYNSLEDRIVKRHFTGVDVDAPPISHLSQHDRIRTNYNTSLTDIEERLNSNKRWLPLTKHVIRPTDEEMAANPRSRSAKLRAAIRLD